MALVPMVLEETARGERSYDLYSRLLRDRIIMLPGALASDEQCQLIVGQMLFLASENPEQDINLYLNSPGGIVTGGLAIYDTMKTIKPRVNVFVTGQAASMGAFLTSCATGKRYAGKCARIMLHHVRSGGSGGTVTDQVIGVEEMKRLNEILMREISQNCGKTYEEVYQDCIHDRFFSAEEAIAYGLIDEVIPEVHKNRFP